jgi:preprotein translocase subunit SecG
MQNILRVMTLVSALLLMLFVLIQTRGASLGAGFGGSGEIHTTRRGVDQTVHQITVILALIFALSILLTVIVGR